MTDKHQMEIDDDDTRRRKRRNLCLCCNRMLVKTTYWEHQKRFRDLPVVGDRHDMDSELDFSLGDNESVCEIDTTINTTIHIHELKNFGKEEVLEGKEFQYQYQGQYAYAILNTLSTRSQACPDQGAPCPSSISNSL